MLHTHTVLLVISLAILATLLVSFFHLFQTCASFLYSTDQNFISSWTQSHHVLSLTLSTSILCSSNYHLHIYHVQTVTDQPFLVTRLTGSSSYSSLEFFTSFFTVNPHIHRIVLYKTQPHARGIAGQGSLGSRPPSHHKVVL